MTEAERDEEWQTGPEGQLANEVTALTRAVSALFISSLHGERRQYFVGEMNAIEEQHVSLGRIVSRFRKREAA